MTKKNSQLTIYDIGGKLGTPPGHFGGEIGTERLFELLQLKKGENIHVLEVGCGTGITSCRLAKEFGFKVTGIDLSQDMVEGARKRAKNLEVDNVDFIVASVYDLPFDDSTFDLIIGESATAVIPDKQKAVKEYARVLKEGGMIGNLDLFLDDKAPPEVGKNLSELLMGAVGDTVVIPTIKEWKRLFEEAGLDYIQTEEYRDNVMEVVSRKAMRKEYGLLGMVTLSFKLCYYLTVNRSYRRLFRKILKARKVIFVKDKDKFAHVGYFVLSGKKPNLS
ncbi:MAG: class I SAM-dependent methyltransferase [Candidatus Odinarchaeota archaeon]